MKVYLERKGYSYSAVTVHKYMNTELDLRSIVRPKKPGYEHGKPHKVFDNQLNQNFTADEMNRKWCTDFTYLFLANHEVRYNCTIIDLHDRSVIASITDRNITSDLAIRTLRKALESQSAIKEGLILHSDQGSQYTSKAFIEFCKSVHVTQSMSKAGYPYDNAPMERYFNTLKNECTNLYEFTTEEWKTYKYDSVAISGVEICEANSQSLYLQVPHENGVANIVTLHGQAGVVSGVDQVNISKLKNKGIDYLALGHIHTYAEQTLDGKDIYCYSGCLEGRGFDECGPKGFVLLTVDSDRIQHEFVPFSRRQLHRILVDITGLTKNSEIGQKMKRAAQNISSDDMVEFVLSGGIDPMANIALSYLQNLAKSNFFFVKVKDETRMTINPEDYKNDISLKS